MYFRQTILDQQAELQRFISQDWVPREAAVEFNRPTRLIRIITGVRRSGKSTLAMHQLKGTSFGYVNFDDERLSGLDPARLNDVLSSVYEVYGDVTCLFFDEIQNVHDWSLFINRLQRAGNQIVVTGSNSKLLSSELATHITGRYKTIELFPFSFSEFLVAQKMDAETSTTRSRALVRNAFQNYMLSGGFPEILVGQENNRYARDLFFSIISRDILNRYQIQNPRAFKDLAVFLATNTGKEISYNRLKNLFLLGSAHTAKNYVDYLEEAYVVSTIGKFSWKNQETLRYRKSYIIDVAFFHALTGSGTANTGFLFETIVYLELLSRKEITGNEYYYYKGKQEVDFVVRHNLEIIALIQVCHDTSDIGTLKREVNGLLEASEALKCDHLMIITDNQSEERDYGDKVIRFCPITDWLLDKKNRF